MPSPTVHATPTAAETAGVTPDERELLITDNIPLVRHVVAHVAAGFPPYIDRSELDSAGMEGLVKAAERYRPEAGVPFPRYAEIRIRGAVLDATRSRDWATRGVRRDMRGIESATATLRGRLQREPATSEVADELGTTTDRLEARRTAAATSMLLRLDRVLHDQDSDATLGSTVREIDPSWLPEEALERTELLGTLRVALARLPQQQRDVVVDHHLEGRLLRAIAHRLGLTEARVSQINSEAIHALRAFFGTVFEGVGSIPEGAVGVRRRDAYVTTMATDTTWRQRLDAGAAGAAPITTSPTSDTAPDRLAPVPWETRE